MSDRGARADTTATPPSASTVRRTGRQRRPTGAPPPLPRRIALSTTAWLVLAAIFVTGAFLVSERTPWRRTVDQASTWLLRRLAAARTPWLTDLANGINVAGLDWYPLIVAIHKAHKGRYGIDRIHADLARNGYPVSPKRVRRLARAAGLRCVHPRPYKATTVQDPANACGLVNLVDRDFVPEAKDQLWYGDSCAGACDVPDRGWLWSRMRSQCRRVRCSPSAPGRSNGDRVSAGAITNVPPRPEQARGVQRVQAGVQHRDPLAGILTAGRLPGGLATDAEHKAATVSVGR